MQEKEIYSPKECADAARRYAAAVKAAEPFSSTKLATAKYPKDHHVQDMLTVSCAYEFHFHYSTFDRCTPVNIQNIIEAEDGNTFSHLKRLEGIFQTHYGQNAAEGI